MAKQAEKPVEDARATRRPGGVQGGGARRRQAAQADAVPGLPPGDLTPEARSAVSRLMAELERVKQELLAAQKRVVELETKADEDALLPVLNRRGFDREMERTLAYSRRHRTDVSLIYIDLDDFKAINDLYGHATGDAALRHVSDILLANVRRSDVVARIGGDEFAILLHHADEDAARAKAGQLARALASSALVHEGREIAMSLTTGTTQLRRGDTAADVMERADKLMYAGKTRRKRARSA